MEDSNERDLATIPVPWLGHPRVKFRVINRLSKGTKSFGLGKQSLGSDAETGPWFWFPNLDKSIVNFLNQYFEISRKG